MSERRGEKENVSKGAGRLDGRWPYPYGKYNYIAIILT